MNETIESFEIQSFFIKIEFNILKNNEDLVKFDNILKENQSIYPMNYSLLYRVTRDGDNLNSLIAKTQDKVPLCFLIKVKED